MARTCPGAECAGDRIFHHQRAATKMRGPAERSDSVRFAKSSYHPSHEATQSATMLQASQHGVQLMVGSMTLAERQRAMTSAGANKNPGPKQSTALKFVVEDTTITGVNPVKSCVF